ARRARSRSRRAQVATAASPCRGRGGRAFRNRRSAPTSRSRTGRSVRAGGRRGRSRLWSCDDAARQLRRPSCDAAAVPEGVAGLTRPIKAYPPAGLLPRGKRATLERGSRRRQTVALAAVGRRAAFRTLDAARDLRKTLWRDKTAEECS